MLLLETILFYVFSAIAVISALFVVIKKNPVSSAVSLIITFLSLAGFYALLNAHFIAAVQILVYAGAIMVLFLFVIMLMDLKVEESILKKFRGQKFFGIVFAAILLIEVYLVINALNVSSLTKEVYSPENIIEGGGNTKVIGKLLFTDFLLPFEVTSVLLLVAIVGAVFLGKKEN